MKKALLDISVILDLFLNRAPWATDAPAIWDAHVNGQLQVSLAAFSVPTIFYIVRRQSDLTAAREAVRVCLATLEVVPTDHAVLETARTMPGSDFG
jgi:predicted nucleic acid-binding protein